MAALRNEALAPRRATYQHVLDAPVHQVAEIIDGTLHTHQRPAPLHTIAASHLGDELTSPFGKGRGGLGGWRILDEPDAPSRLRHPRAGPRGPPPQANGGPYRHAVFQPRAGLGVRGDVRLDLQGKRPVYTREGVGHLWLVDPPDRTLEVFDLRDSQRVLIATGKDDESVSVRPFDALTFSLGGLWP